MQVGYTSPALGPMAAQLGLSPGTQALFSSLVALGAMPGALAAGPFSERVGRRTALGVAAGLLAAHWLAIGVSSVHRPCPFPPRTRHASEPRHAWGVHVHLPWPLHWRSKATSLCLHWRRRAVWRGLLRIAAVLCRAVLCLWWDAQRSGVLLLSRFVGGAGVGMASLTVSALAPTRTAEGLGKT